MKKLLLLAALLLSSAAQAETFVCNSTSKAIVGIVDLMMNELELQDQYILDTNKETLRITLDSGDRVTEPKAVRLKCSEYDQDLILCIEDRGFPFDSVNPLHRFAVQRDGVEINFSYNRTRLIGGLPADRVSVGSCTEL